MSKRLLIIIGLIGGPLIAWLIWAVANRRWGWAALALSVNVIDWTMSGFLLHWVVTRMLP